jgi:hypothetical protein
LQARLSGGHDWADQSQTFAVEEKEQFVVQESASQAAAQTGRRVRKKVGRIESPSIPMPSLPANEVYKYWQE